MLVRAIKGTDLLDILGNKNIHAVTPETTESLDVDPEGYSVIAEDLSDDTFHSIALLVKVTRDSNPRIIYLQMNEPVYSTSIRSKERTFWLENSNDRN